MKKRKTIKRKKRTKSLARMIKYTSVDITLYIKQLFYCLVFTVLFAARIMRLKLFGNAEKIKN